jgi:hypothetical protein
MQQIQQAQIDAQHPAEKPKIALQLKATTSAPVAGEILREAGVQVSDEQVAEPPLETWVTRQRRQGGRQRGGEQPAHQLEQMQSMQQSQETHALKLAKAAHEVASRRREGALRNLRRAERQRRRAS